MELIDRQIEAVEEILRRVKREYIIEENHSFNIRDCPLCEMFYKNRKSFEKCLQCPLNFAEALHGCRNFVDMVDLDDEEHLEDIAGFLTSLLISLKESKQ